MERTPLFLLRNGGRLFVDNQCNYNCISSATDKHVAKAKTLFIFLTITLMAVGLSSCKKEIVGPDNNSGTPDTPASEYIVSNLTMSIPAEGGRLFFLIQDYGCLDGLGDKRPCRQLVELLTYQWIVRKCHSNGHGFQKRRI